VLVDEIVRLELPKFGRGVEPLNIDKLNKVGGGMMDRIRFKMAGLQNGS
jgi:hypothetical protein